MIKLIDLRVNPLTKKEHREFICDTDADFADLPKSNPGDTAVSAATCNVKVVNASGNWVEFGGGGGTGETFETTKLIVYNSTDEHCSITYTNSEGEEVNDICNAGEEAYFYDVKTGTNVYLSGNYSSVDLCGDGGNTPIGTYNGEIPLPNYLSETFLMIMG